MDNTEPISNKVIPIIILGAAILIAVVGVSMLGVTLLPYTFVQTQIAPIMLGNRPIEEFTVTLYLSTVSRLRLLSILLCVGAVVIFVARRYIQSYLMSLTSSWSIFLADIQTYFGNLLRQDNKLHLIALGFIFVLGFLLRLVYMDEPIQYDEAVTVISYASKPLPLGLYAGYIPNNHLLHTTLVMPMIQLFGFQEIAVRIPAFIMGVLLIPLTYILVRKLSSPEPALIAASFIAVSSILIQYSTKARGYTLLAALFLTSFILAIYLTEKGKHVTVAWFLFGIIGTLSFFTIPVALYSYGIVALWLLVMIVLRNPTLRSSNLSQMVISLCIGAGFTLLLYSPLVALSGLDRLLGNEYIARLSMDIFMTRIWESLWQTYVEWHRDMPTTLWILSGGLVLSLVSGVYQHDDRRKNHLILMVIVILWTGSLIVIQQVVPYRRVWLFLTPLYYALAVMGLWFALEKILSVRAIQKMGYYIGIGLSLLVTVLFGLNVYTNNSVATANDIGIFLGAESVASYLHDHITPEDSIVMIVPATYTLDFYLEQYDMSYRYYADYESSQTLYVVVNDEYEKSDTPDKVLISIGIDSLDYGKPEEVFSDLDAHLFMYQRIP